MIPAQILELRRTEVNVALDAEAKAATNRRQLV